MSSGISVVICCYNSAERIEPTLESLFRQKFNSQINWEVIVVINASSDNTEEVVRQFIETHDNAGISLKIEHEEKPGLSYARDKGLEVSAYDIILFCDDDNHLADNYLETGFNILNSNEKIGVLGGIGTAVFEKERPFWFDPYEVNYATGIPWNPLRDKHLIKNPNWAYGAGVFIKSELLSLPKSIGVTSLLSDRKGKSLSSGGDYEFLFWIYILGYEVTHSEKLRFDHFVPESRCNLDYLFSLSYALGQSSALLEIYQYLLGSSYEIIKPKNNIGWRVSRFYLPRLMRLKLQLLFNRKTDNQKNIALRFGYLNLKGRVQSYLKHNNKINEYIREKEAVLKDYTSKLS